jgi:hypothetical protein
MAFWPGFSPVVRPGACAGFLNSSSDLPPATGNPSYPVMVIDGAGNVKALCPLSSLVSELLGAPPRPMETYAPTGDLNAIQIAG